MKKKKRTGYILVPKTYSPWRYKAPIVEKHVDQLLTGSREFGTVFPLIDCAVSRTFCKAGFGIGYHRDDIEPLGPYKGQSDEIWFSRVSEAVTGNVDENGKPRFREGVAHVILPSGRLCSLQAFLEEQPEVFLGAQTLEYVKLRFGRITPGIYDKYFDNAGPIPHHVHLEKNEAYHISPWVHPRHLSRDIHYTAMGFLPGVSVDNVADSLRAIKNGKTYNGLRNLSPGIPMPMDSGFLMPAGMWHAPAALCTQEPQDDLDEHVLGENANQDGRLSEDDCLFANNTAPKGRSKDWEYVLEKTNKLNWDPEFVKNHRIVPVVDEALSSDEVQVRWVIYGLMEGVQRFSTLEITVQPGCERELCFPSWWIGHMLHGRGEVGGVRFEKLHSFKIGQTDVSQNWFAPYDTATSSGGIWVKNTGPEVMVFKATFGWNAWPEDKYLLIGY